VVQDSDAVAAETVRSELPDTAAHTAVSGDVAVRETHARAADAAATLAPIRGWVNCAGITVHTPWAGLEEARVRRILEVNLLGTMWGTAAALDRLGEGGAVVNVSSVHGRQAFDAHMAYEASKAAIEAVTRNAALDGGPRRVRVNAVAPGSIDTPALRASFVSAPDAGAAQRDLESWNPLGRIAQPQEVAGAIAFLLSNDASYITGETLMVDAGLTIGLRRSAERDNTRRSNGGSLPTLSK